MSAGRVEVVMVDETVAARRRVFGRVAGVLTVGVAGWLGRARAATMADPGSESWPGALSGTFHQVFDGVESRNGKVLAYAANFLVSNPEGAAASVAILRDVAVVIALESEIWARYRIGEALHFTDPETGTPAVKNPFLRPKPGVLASDGWAVDRLVAAGVAIGACNMALTGISHSLASRAGVTPEAATAEWRAGLVAGITLLPSGVWGVNRAQRAGCTYCYGT